MNYGMQRILIILLLCLGISGCIVSQEPLFDPSSAVKLLRPGLWQQQEWNRQAQSWDKADGDFRVVVTDGAYKITKTDEPEVMMFRFYPLKGPWHIASGYSSSKPESRLYGLVRMKDGALWSYATTCDAQPEKDLLNYGIQPKPFECLVKSQSGLKRYFLDLIEKGPEPFARFSAATR